MMHSRLWLIVFAFLILSFGCPAEDLANPVSNQYAGEKEDDAFKTCVEGINGTSEFRACFQQPDGGALSRINLSDDLKNCDILIVHGFLGDLGISATHFFNSFKHNQHFVDYLEDQEKAFKELGLKFRTLEFKSRAVDKNGEKIAKMIRDNPRPVIVFSHSKGSLDTLDALLKLQRDGHLKKVAGWVSIQGPFYGTPDADQYLSHWYLRVGASIGLKLLGDDLAAVRDLTVVRREDYMSRHQDEIKQATHTIPTICFASWVPPKDKDKVATMKGALNDGNVPTQSAILPGTTFVAKANVGHKVTVMHAEKPFNRVAFTTALLSMLSSRIVAAAKSPSAQSEVATSR